MTVMTPVNELGNEVEDGEFETTSLSTIESLNRSEIDMQVSTAKRFPRSIARAKRDMIEMATINEEVAKSCGYALKRTDKDGEIVWIEGPSVRMAEIAVSCWGNLRYGSRVIEETDRFIVAQGACYDLEKNIACSFEVRRRITTRYGKKFGDDMVGVTANAACAIAGRNAVMKVVPRIIIMEAYKEAMKCAEGDLKTFTAKRKSAVAAFQALGVTIDEMMTVLGKPKGGIEDIDSTDLRRLHGLLTAINDGESNVEQVFRPKGAEDSSSEKTNDLNAKALAAAEAKAKQARDAQAKAKQGAPTQNADAAPVDQAAGLRDQVAQNDAKPDSDGAEADSGTKQPIIPKPSGASMLKWSRKDENDTPGVHDVICDAAMTLGVDAMVLNDWLKEPAIALIVAKIKGNKASPDVCRKLVADFAEKFGGTVAIA